MEATLDSARPALTTATTTTTTTATGTATGAGTTTGAAATATTTEAVVLAGKPGKRALWTGRVLTGLTVAFLLFSAFAKLSTAPETAASFAELGLPFSMATSLAILELTCIALYTLPATANFGALLLTAYLGGAVAMHVRVGHPMLTHTLFPCYLGALVWIGLALRRPHLLRALLTR